jgi:hypothetical protein
MDILIVLVICLILDIAVGMFAHNYRGRSGFGWFLLAIILSPLLAFLLAVVSKRIEPNDHLILEIEREQQRRIVPLGIGFVAAIVAAIFLAAMASNYLAG